MQVTGSLLGGLAVGRGLCSAWLAASQHAAHPLQTLWKQQHPLTQPQPSSSRHLWPAHSAAHVAGFSSSGWTSSSQEKPDQESTGKQDSTGSSSSEHKGPDVHASAQEVSKGFLAKTLDMEELWFAAVGGKLKVWSAKSHPDLKGREEEITGQAQAAYYDSLQRAASGHMLSTRSRNQMKQACLAAATYKTLVEAVPGSDASAEQFIADLMGGLYAPFMLGGLKFSTWIKRLLLRQSSISQAVDTLHTIARDMEGACHCSVQPLSCGSDSEVDDITAPAAAAAAAAAAGDTSSADANTCSKQQKQQQQQEQFDEKEHEREDEAEAQAAAEAAAQRHTSQQWQLGATLTVDSCLYAEVLNAEGVPQLLKSFCCQHNMSWLDTYRSQGVDSRLEACIAKGDACCRVAVVPVGDS